MCGKQFASLVPLKFVIPSLTVVGKRNGNKKLHGLGKLIKECLLASSSSFVETSYGRYRKKKKKK